MDICCVGKVVLGSRVEEGSRMVMRRAKATEEVAYLAWDYGQYSEEGGRKAPEPGISRRRFLQMGAGAAAGTLLLPVLPRTASAAALVDPYGGSIPLVFPLLYGTYKTPVQNNWHANREGRTYFWNHRTPPHNAPTTELTSILPGAASCPGSMRRSLARLRRSARARQTRSTRL